MSDDAAIARIRAGDREAFEALFRMHYAGLIRFAYAQCGDRGEAEDIVHDVFLRLWQNHATLMVRGSVRSYLLGAVRNGVIDGRRRRAAGARSIAQYAAPGVTVHAAGDRGDPAHEAELGDAIRRAIAALPERCRTAFLLCREQDLTYAEAADVMGVSSATVKTQMARALASLRGALEPFLLVIAAAAATLS